MVTQSLSLHSDHRPDHIRYFEHLQFAGIAIELVAPVTEFGGLILLALLIGAPLWVVLVALVLAVSRGRRNWARWVLLILFIFSIAPALQFFFLPDDLPDELSSNGRIAAALELVALILRGVSLGFVFTTQSSAWLHEKGGRGRSEEGGELNTRQQQPARSHVPSHVRARIADWRCLVWTALSMGGAAAGGWLAVTLYPSAGFAQNPTGQFAWNLVYFALTVGLLFGVAQSLALFLVGRSTNLELVRLGVATVLWVPATTIGIFAMIFPLWWLDADVLIMMPPFMWLSMASGIALLSVLQWAVVRIITRENEWLWRTAVGGSLGALLGLYIGGFVSTVIPIPGEALCAGAIGLIIGAAQSKPIKDLVGSKLTPSSR